MGRWKDTDRRDHAWALECCGSVAAQTSGATLRGRQPVGRHRRQARLNIQRNLDGGTWQDAWILVGPESVAAVTADPDSRNQPTPAAGAESIPMSIPVARLNHAVLFVRDAERAADFYTRIFGFEVVGREMGGQAIFLRSPLEENHHDLGLFSVGPQAQNAPRGSVGLYHLAWEVPTITDLAAARDLLAEAGALGGASDHGVSKSLYGRDPDGNEFEVMWRVPREAWGEDEHRGVIRPLDLDMELARFGGQAATTS